MPCTYDPSPEEIEQDIEDNAPNTKAYKALLEKHQKLAQITCALCEHLISYGHEYNGFSEACNNIPDLEVWWNDHQMSDRERAEKVLKKIQSKLTPDEQEVLRDMPNDSDILAALRGTKPATKPIKKK